MTAANLPFVVHWSDIIDADDAHYPGSDELLSIGSPLGRATGLTRIGIHHEVVPPGRRTSWPHAEADEEEFVFVLSGSPDVWLDGTLYRLRPGDGVGFPSGTGIAHTFINNTASDVRLLVLGESNVPGARIHYPLHPARNASPHVRHWDDVPARDRGTHDGLADARVREVGRAARREPAALETARLRLRPVPLTALRVSAQGAEQTHARGVVPWGRTRVDDRDIYEASESRVWSLHRHGSHGCDSAEATSLAHCGLVGIDRARGTALFYLDSAIIASASEEDAALIREGAMCVLESRIGGDTPFRRIEARISVRDGRLMALVESLGFMREGTRRAVVPEGDQWGDEAIFARVTIALG